MQVNNTSSYIDHSAIDRLLGQSGAYDKLPVLEGWFPPAGKYPDDCPSERITHPMMRFKQLMPDGETTTEYLVFKFTILENRREGSHVIFWKQNETTLQYHCDIHGGAPFAYFTQIEDKHNLREFFQRKELATQERKLVNGEFISVPGPTYKLCQ